MLGYRREVSVADAIKKPIIPLIMDAEIQWPPAGPMGKILSQLTYFSFCEPNEAVQNDWNCPQYDKLTSKIKKFLDVSCAHQPSFPLPPPPVPAHQLIVCITRSIMSWSCLKRRLFTIIHIIPRIQSKIKYIYWRLVTCEWVKVGSVFYWQSGSTRCHNWAHQI